MPSFPIVKTQLTPNHLDKRRRIIEAAQTVLRRDGVSACSTRAIANESGFNKGLIHYYFGNLEEIIDAATAEMAADIVERIRATSARHEDPARRFWSIVMEHLAAFENPKGQTILWMDYWLDAMRRSRKEVVGQIDQAVIDALTDALADAKVSSPRTRAQAISAYVVGVAIRRTMHGQSDTELLAEIELMSGGIRQSP